MASELLYVMKNRNSYEKDEERKRKDEVENLRREGLFRVALNSELDIIRNILEDGSIESVELQVDIKSLGEFGSAFGYEEMQAYDIRQKYGTTDTFIVRRKEINLY